MTEAPLTRAECLQSTKRFVSIGLDYALVPILSASHASTIWQSKVETDTLADVFNVSVRGRRNVLGGLSAFAIKVELDPIYRTPVVETPVYGFLNDLGTMRFDAGTSVSFLFRCDEFVSISESAERIYAEPLKSATLVCESGFTGFGVLNDAFGRSHRVTCHGDEPLKVRQVPALIDALKRTGKFTMSASAHLGSAMTGPPLL
jgi:hypothetical protein